MTQQEALDILKLGHNAFITGAAGSGKTYVLNEYIKYLQDNEVAVGVTASTGIAASHMGGMTIHAWSGLGIRDSLSPYDLEDMAEKPYLWKRFEKAKVLIIDEVSMLHHFRLDLVDKIAREFKRNQEPFGGLQVVLCGDFFQLPPITRAGEPDACFAYHSPAWKNLQLKICYLHEYHRQSDKTYLNILNAIRSGEVSDDIIRCLKGCQGKPPKVAAEPTKLYSHNVNVDAENERELDKLPGQTLEYEMSSHGRAALVETLKKSCLSPALLRLKKGARVMFVKNNYELGYVNGTLGVVERLGDYGITVRTASGKQIDAPLASWTIEEDGKVKAEITQYPLRLAWAITVHKSQGMSLDAAEVDLSRSFAPGMGYVALSRLRSLDGLSLLGLNAMALKVNDEVLEFDEQFVAASIKDTKEFAQLAPAAVKAGQKEWLDRIAPKVTGKGKQGLKEKLPTYEVTKMLLEEGKSLKEITLKRGLALGTILSHLETIKDKDPNVALRYLLGETPVLRQKKIRQALAVGGMVAGKYPLAPAKALLGDSFSYEEIRLVRLMI